MSTATGIRNGPDVVPEHGMLTNRRTTEALLGRMERCPLRRDRRARDDGSA